MTGMTKATASLDGVAKAMASLAKAFHPMGFRIDYECMLDTDVLDFEGSDLLRSLVLLYLPEYKWHIFWTSFFPFSKWREALIVFC